MNRLRQTALSLMLAAGLGLSLPMTEAWSQDTDGTWRNSETSQPLNAENGYVAEQGIIQTSPADGTRAADRSDADDVDATDAQLTGSMLFIYSLLAALLALAIAGFIWYNGKHKRATN